LPNEHRGILAGIKLAGREIDNLQKTSAGFKNEWSYISTPSIRLLGVDRDKVTFRFNSFTGLFYYVLKFLMNGSLKIKKELN
jgi:hypothetical protein